jgi:hypothetical protein
MFALFATFAHFAISFETKTAISFGFAGPMLAPCEAHTFFTSGATVCSAASGPYRAL